MMPSLINCRYKIIWSLFSISHTVVSIKFVNPPHPVNYEYQNCTLVVGTLNVFGHECWSLRS